MKWSSGLTPKQFCLVYQMASSSPPGYNWFSLSSFVIIFFIQFIQNVIYLNVQMAVLCCVY